MSASLVDSDVLIDYLRDSGPAVELLERMLVDDGPPLASVVTRADIAAGARSGELERIGQLFRAIVWAPVTVEIAERAGELSRKYGRHSNRATLPDYLIAATAQLRGARLVTRNVRLFPMFPQLRPPYEL